MIILLVLCPKK